MKNCQAKRGFFTLYDCGKEDRAVCLTCKRSLCHEHFPEDMKECLECFALKNSFIDKETPMSRQHLVTAYKARQNMLRENKGKTIFLGSDLDQFYSQYDLRSFDLELSSIAEMADSPDEIYFDS